jgi:hypothetical protein
LNSEQQQESWAFADHGTRLGDRLRPPDTLSKAMLLSMLLAAGLHAAPKDVLARNGHSDWSIVVKGSSPAARHGAEELQFFLAQITGAKLPLESDVIPGSKAITIEEDGEPEEAFSIRSTPSGIVIKGGGKRGAMYGCYGFLQDVLGCRWYTRTVSVIPKTRTLILPPINLREQPAFELREPCFSEAFDRDWAVRNRVNGNSMPLDESVGGKVSYGRFVHTFAELVPPSRYFKAHPEYFSLVNGKRQDGYAQLCLTNPDVLRIVVAGVKEWIKQNPNATIFSVSQNDTYLNCQCDNCKEVEQEEKSPSGPLLRFVNKVADEVGKDYPNVLIDTLAYQWSEKPPLLEKPHKNVRVRLALINACFAHPLDGCPANATAFANLKAWSKITNQLYIWHYCTDFRAYLQPLPDLDEIGTDVKLFKNNGVVGLYYEGDYSSTGGDMAELKSYLLARLMWNPDQPAQPIIDEFLSAVYGAAAPKIQGWLNLVHQGARKDGLHASIYDAPTAPYFSPQVLAEGDALFNDAEISVQADPPALEEVRKARLGLQYVEFMRMPDNDPHKLDAARRLADGIRHFGIQQTSEGGSSADFLKEIGQ